MHVRAAPIHTPFSRLGQKLLPAAALGILVSTLVNAALASEPETTQRSTAAIQIAPGTNAMAAHHNFSGRLQLDTRRALNMTVIRDDYGFAANPDKRVDELPAFDFELVHDGDVLIPLQRGSIASDHPHWEYILEPGRAWSDGDGRTSFASLPVTLQEVDSNCMHNGLLAFSIDDDNQLSAATLRIASETCLYFKYRMWGELDAQLTPTQSKGARAAATAYRQRQVARLPTRPIAELRDRYPGVKLTAFSGNARLPLNDITTYGFVMDGIHYRGPCPTLDGEHPYCEALSLPSYSLAKTLVAGLGLMRLEALYPGSRMASIASGVPECRPSGNWDDVTLEQALNMLSGNYGSKEGRDDEGAQRTDEQFFYRSQHADKVDFSCNAWPRRTKPGSTWVYHTTDTYLVGTAMNALLRQHRGPQADFYRDLILPLWQDLNLSPALNTTRRTRDTAAQPFTGFGLTLIPDDIARLATALNRMEFAGELDRSMYESAMQRLSTPQGSWPVDGYYYYQHGFWGFDASELLGCEAPLVVPYMTGYGGISVVMMPNDTVYYIFGDSGVFAFADVLTESHRLRPLCPQQQATDHNNNNEESK